jgi:hypothetical protein
VRCCHSGRKKKKNFKPTTFFILYMDGRAKGIERERIYARGGMLCNTLEGKNQSLLSLHLLCASCCVIFPKHDELTKRKKKKKKEHVLLLLLRWQKRDLRC